METGQKGALTPEQIAQIQNHGTADMPVPVMPPVENTQPTAPVASPRQTPRISPIRPTKPQTKVSNITTSTAETPKVSNLSGEVKSYNGKTYFFFEGEKKEEEDDSEAMEMDLVTFRERGTETRYLSVSIYGTEVVGDANKIPERQYTSLIIDNKEDFEKLKEFISNLNWDD